MTNNYPAFYPNQMSVIWYLAKSENIDFQEKLKTWIPNTTNRMENLLKFIGIKDEDLTMTDWTQIGPKYKNTFGQELEYEFNVIETEGDNLYDFYNWQYISYTCYTIRTDTNTIIYTLNDCLFELDPMEKTICEIKDRCDETTTKWSFLYCRITAKQFRELNPDYESDLLSYARGQSL